MELVNFEMHLPENDNFPVAFRNAKMDKNTDFGINWHRNIEILVCTDGEGSVEIDGIAYEFTKGNIIVIDSYRLHAVKTKNNLECYIIIYDPDFCADNGINTDKIQFQKRVSDDKLWDLFNNIVWESNQNDEYRSTGIRSAALAFLLHIVRLYSKKIIGDGKRTGDKVVENMRVAVGYIKSHFTKTLTIDEICGKVGLSRYHFVREFKKIIGITPVSYINSLRIDKAKRMLLTGKSKISEVQEECGFDNASYFTALFKRITGRTPTEFLKENNVTDSSY